MAIKIISRFDHKSTLCQYIQTYKYFNIIILYIRIKPLPAFTSCIQGSLRLVPNNDMGHFDRKRALRVEN